MKPRESLEKWEQKAVDYLAEKHGIALKTIPEDDNAKANLDFEIGGKGWELKSPGSGKHAVDDRLTDAIRKFRKLGDKSPRIIICNSESTRKDEDVYAECVDRLTWRVRNDPSVNEVDFLFISNDGKTIRHLKIE